MSISPSPLTENSKLRHIIESLTPGRPIKVLFVCLGNICRSPAAEGVLKEVVAAHGDEHMWVIDSAGTGRWHIGQLPDHRMRIHARRRGLELDHHCRQVTVTDFEEFDIIIPMDHSNLDDLMELAPSVEAQQKLVPMATFLLQAPRYDYIPDPYYEGAAGFELVLDLLSEGCEELYNIVTELRNR